MGKRSLKWCKTKIISFIKKTINLNFMWKSYFLFGKWMPVSLEISVSLVTFQPLQIPLAPWMFLVCYFVLRIFTPKSKLIMNWLLPKFSFFYLYNKTNTMIIVIIQKSYCSYLLSCRSTRTFRSPWTKPSVICCTCPTYKRKNKNLNIINKISNT